MTMNAEVKQAWLDALRSGKYKQGKGQLRSTYSNKSMYCCLGVLCDLHSQKHGVSWTIKEDDFPSCHRYFGEINYCPGEVSEWSGLSGPDAQTLADMNDDGDNFNEIAQYIEDAL